MGQQFVLLLVQSVFTLAGLNVCKYLFVAFLGRNSSATLSHRIAKIIAINIVRKAWKLISRANYIFYINALLLRLFLANTIRLWHFSLPLSIIYFHWFLSLGGKPSQKKPALIR